MARTTKARSPARTRAPEPSPLPPGFAILPWLQSAWNQLLKARYKDRLHHAYLISGLPGLGKLDFAYHIAHSLLCTSPTTNGYPCGQCRGCHLFQVGNHPDVQRIAPDPESKSGEIKVETIRTLVEFNGLSAQSGGYKVIIIAPAEGMNRYAANSLLKTLEEPTQSTIVFLVTAQPGRLLPTVRSRCQHLPIPIPQEQEGLSWLANQAAAPQDVQLALRLARGAPLAALGFNADLLQQRYAALEAFFELTSGKRSPSTMAEQWVQQDIHLLLTWLSGWLADLLRLKTGDAAIFLDNPDLATLLLAQGGNYDSVNIHRFWSHVIDTRRQLQTNLNPQLLIEALLIQWSEMQP